MLDLCTGTKIGDFILSIYFKHILYAFYAIFYPHEVCLIKFVQNINVISITNK